MARQPRQPASPELKKRIKLSVEIDASLYVRLAGAAAMRQVTHSAYMAEALDEKLRSEGITIVRRRFGGQGDSPVTVEESADDAA